MSQEEQDRIAYLRERGAKHVFTPYELEVRALRSRDLEAYKKPTPLTAQFDRECRYDYKEEGLSFDPRVSTKQSFCSKVFDWCCCCCICCCCREYRRRRKRQKAREKEMRRKSRESMDERASRGSRGSMDDDPRQKKKTKKKRCCLVRWLCCCCCKDAKKRAKFPKGTKVECRYRAGKTFYPGRVTDFTEEGLYVIEYEEGGIERGIKEEFIRMPKRAAPVEETKQEAPKTPEKVKTPEKKEEPAGPPEPWETHETHDGNTYYWNRLTGETSWTLPEAPKLKAAAAPAPKKPKKKRSWCFGRRKPAPKTLVVAAEHHSHSTFEHPEAAARDDFDFPARLAPEFPAPLKDDMVVEDLEDDYPLENHMDELHGPLVVND